MEQQDLALLSWVLVSPPPCARTAVIVVVGEVVQLVAGEKPFSKYNVTASSVVSEDILEAFDSELKRA